MSTRQKIIKCKLDGKQSFSFPFEIKKNGYLLTDPVEILVRGILKFEDFTSISFNYETDQYQKKSANLVEDRTIIYPVLFSSRRFTITNGKGIITLLPRSEDIFPISSTILQNVGSFLEDNNFIITEESLKISEQLTELSQDPATIIIRTGEIRTPYKISIELTVFDESYYAQTIDRGTDPLIEESQNSLFFHEQTKIPSNLIIECYNDDDWIPSIDSILKTYNEGTQSEILSEILNLEHTVPFGSSAMYDAIVKGTEILSANNVESTRKLIYVLTDNESNMSINTLNETIEKVNNINGEKNTPLLVGNSAIVDPITLSVRSNISDTKNLNKMCFKTGGQCITIVDEKFLNDVVEIFTGEAEGALGYGTYEFLLDFGQQVHVNNIISNFYLPDERSNGSWEIFVSDNNYSYTSLNKIYSADEEVEFTDLYTRYIKFKVILLTGFGSAIGDEYIPFSFPALTSIRIEYNLFNKRYLYLNLTKDEIIPSQITLAVNANDIDSNQIKVGLAKSNSHTWTDFYSSSQPLIDQNGKIVIPLRYSQDINEFPQEPLSKIDNFTLKTKYGSWDPYSSVTLYNEKNEIISLNEYQSYPRDGLVIFAKMINYEYSDGDYTISILNQNNHKIGLELLNKSTEKRLEIDGIGYMYTTSKNLLPLIDKIPPEARDVIISPEVINKYTKVTLAYTYYDVNNDKEDKAQTLIKWYINNIHISYLDNLLVWNDVSNQNDPLYINTNFSSIENSGIINASIINPGDNIYCTVKVSDGGLFGNFIKSNIIEAIESKPTIDNVIIQGLQDDGSIVDRLTSNTVALVKFNFHSDSDINRSEIIWFVNGFEFKRNLYGIENADRILPGEVSPNGLSLGLVMLNEIAVKIIPQAAQTVGEPIDSSVYVVKNALPTVSDVILLPQQPNQHQNLTLTWSFFDYEIDALDDASQTDMTTVKLYRKNPLASIFEEVTDVASLNQIDFNYDNKIIIINSSLIIVGQVWKAIITPNDSLDDGIPITSNIIMVTSANN